MRARLQASWAALAALGALAVVLSAMVTVRTPGAVLPPEPRAAVRLSSGDTLRWGFTTEQGGLVGIELWLAEPPPPGAELVVRITPADNPTVALAETAVALDGGTDGRVEARFAPIWVRSSPYDQGVALVVELTPQGLATGTELAVQGGAGGPAFTPFYSVRPFDRLWPISAMAEGRTGPLGMPSFYALVAYCFLVALLRSLWLVARAARGAQAPAEH